MAPLDRVHAHLADRGRQVSDGGLGQAGEEEERREHVVEFFEELRVALELEVDLAAGTGAAQLARRARARSIAPLSCSTVNGLVTYSLAPTARPLTRSSWAVRAVTMTMGVRLVSRSSLSSWQTL